MVGLSWSAFDHARSDQLVAVVPRRELSGGDAPLGPVENEVSPFVADEQPRALQGLAVADADGEPGALPGGQLPGGFTQWISPGTMCSAGRHSPGWASPSPTQITFCTVSVARMNSDSLRPPMPSPLRCPMV